MNAQHVIPSLVSATLLALLCCAHPLALAQNRGNGKVLFTIEGKLTDSTCVVYFSEPSNSNIQAINDSSSTLKLTPVKRKDLEELTSPGDLLTATAPKFTIVSLGASNPNIACSLDGKSSWDFEISSQNTKTIGNKVFLSSVAPESGSTTARSNVLIQLKAKMIESLINPDTSGAVDVKPSNTQTLGAQLSSSSVLTASKGFAIGAVYARPEGTPTAGSFFSPIVLSVKYP